MNRKRRKGKKCITLPAWERGKYKEKEEEIVNGLVLKLFRQTSLKEIWIVWNPWDDQVRVWIQTIQIQLEHFERNRVQRVPV